jgi:hypothetical protein
LRLAQLVEETVLLDGELVALDSEGRPSFPLLQHRMHVQTPSARLLAATPVQYVVFDLLHRADRSLLTLPYVQQRAMLADLGLNTVGVVRTPPHHMDITGAELPEVARVNSLEGVVAKRLQRSSACAPHRRRVDLRGRLPHRRPRRLGHTPIARDPGAFRAEIQETVHAADPGVRGLIWVSATLYLGTGLFYAVSAIFFSVVVGLSVS